MTTMTLTDLLPPERVREIGKKVWKDARWTDGNHIALAAEQGIVIAAPEIARAALEWAARRFDNLPTDVDAAEELRQLAKEIADAN